MLDAGAPPAAPALHIVMSHFWVGLPSAIFRPVTGFFNLFVLKTGQWFLALKRDFHIFV